MKNEYLPNEDESSINAKKRNIENSIETLTKSKQRYNCIKTFGIITLENPNSQSVGRIDNNTLLNDLKKSIKGSGYVWVEQLGVFNNKTKHSLFIFNISSGTLKYFSDKYNQTSYFFCEIVDENGKQETKSSYYEVEDDEKPFNKIKNPRVLKETTTNILVFDDDLKPEAYSQIGNKFKYTFPLKCFGYVNDELNDKIHSQNKEDVIEAYIHHTGWSGLSLRICLSKGITEKVNNILKDEIYDFQ